jgi:hypothetical protein
MFGLGRFFWKNVDEQSGPSVWLGRDTLIYSLGSRKMAITVDCGGNEVRIFTDTIGRWNDDPDTRIDEAQRARILEEIKWDLEARGLVVEALD